MVGIVQADNRTEREAMCDGAHYQIKTDLYSPWDETVETFFSYFWFAFGIMHVSCSNVK